MNEISRRKLMFSLPAVFAGLHSVAEAQKFSRFRRKKLVAQAPSLVYFGTDTSRGGE